MDPGNTTGKHHALDVRGFDFDAGPVFVLDPCIAGRAAALPAARRGTAPRPERHVGPLHVVRAAAHAAARLTNKARSLGLDVIHGGNASSFNFLHTMVIDRSGTSDRADQVASVLGIGNRIQQVTDDAYRLADVTVVIGRDFRQLNLLTKSD